MQIPMKMGTLNDSAGVCRRVRALRVFVTFTSLLAVVLASRPVQGDEITSGPPGTQVTENDRAFWSFQRIARPAVPGTVAATRVRSPVDAFLLSTLESQRLSFSPDVDSPTLMRRVWLDLVGIPPSPEAGAEFLADESPDAFERLVDRLLASPQFGERWGRHWLDLAGYVDTVGFDVDVDTIIVSERKWLYRDYVIQAFNNDKPYDRFLHEQLAGDELVDWRRSSKFTPEIRDLLVATGFLRTAQDFTHEEVGNIPQNHFGILHDTLEIVGTGLLGLTLNCARCHDHKFDPVPQEDYYRLMAVFTPAYNPNEWKIVFPYDKKLADRSLADVSPAERAQIESHNVGIERRIAELSEKLGELRRPYRERMFEQKLATIPEPIRADTKTAIAIPADKRNEVQAYLADKFAGSLKITDDEITAILSDGDKAATAEIAAQSSNLAGQRQSFGKIQALFDVGPPPVTRRLIRGNFETPGDEVQPGILRVLCDADASGILEGAIPPHAGTSGRRLALAQSLTARDARAAGLISRVMVNRIWQHLFQAGIVSTPENFGIAGAPPSHPQLLDWLAAQFVESGWKIKPLIRLIVCSTVYRQSAARILAVESSEISNSNPDEIDPENRLLWRMPLKRLDSEVIRDCILASSGTIDATIGGPPIMLEGKPDGTIVVSGNQAPTARARRSVYLLARRSFPLSELAVFDQPVVATNCLERARSAVPLQSLALLNGAFLWEQADQFAVGLERSNAHSAQDQILVAFQRVLARQPSVDERRRSVDFLEHQATLYRDKGLDGRIATHKALTRLCHTLLNTSEFLYTP